MRSIKLLAQSAVCRTSSKIRGFRCWTRKLKSYSLYLFDLDGTIYRGREALPFAGQVVAELIRRGSKVRFLTNNSAERQPQVSALLNHLGVICKPEWIYGSGKLAASYCKSNGYSNVLVVGEMALVQTMIDEGLTVSEDSPDAVVAGICRMFSYELLDKSSRFIRQGLPFIATNRDATYPLEGGRFQPGAGAIVASIEVASGHSPLVLGKPEPHLALQAIADAGCSPQETLVVGDRFDTDILCGQAAGCDTYLVLTGVETSVPQGVKGGSDLRGII